MPIALIVDDEIDFLELVSAYLEEKGVFEILTAPSAEEALRLLRSYPVEVIVSDYQMPGTDGIGLLKRVRREYGGIPFIMFTGRGREQIAIQALNEGADFYLQKAGDPRTMFAELHHVMESALSRWSAEKALEHNARRFRTLIENSSDLILTIDGASRIGYVSPSSERLLGYGPEEMANRSLRDILDPEGIIRLKEAIDTVSSLPGRREKIEVGLRHRKGHWLTFEAELIADRDSPDGDRLILNARDVTERKRLEGELRQSREEKDIILDSLLENVVYKDRDSRIIWVNRAAAESVGMRPEEMIGRYCYELWHGRDTPCEGCPVIQAMEMGEPCSGVVANPKGWRRVYGVPVTDHDGRVIGAVEAALDVTEMMVAETTLRESEERYRMVTERSPHGVFILQHDRLEFVNEALCRISGYTREELAHMDYLELIHPDFREEIRAYIQMVSEGRWEALPTQVEFLGLPKEGEPMWVLLNGSVIEYEGEPAVLGNLMDVTEKRKAEAALRESEERYRTVFETADTAMILIEEDMSISLVNKEFVRLTGYSKEEVKGKLRTIDIVSPKEREKITEYHHQRRIDPALAPSGYELEILTKSGEIKECRLTISIINGTKRAVASITDLTQLRAMGRELKKLSVEQEMLLDNIDVMAWYATDPETYGLVNRARAEFIGLPKEEIIGRRLREILPESVCEVCIEGNRRAFAGEKVVQEEWLTTPGGELRCLLVSKTPRFNDRGEVEYVFCTATDITERKNMERALQLANDKLRLLFRMTMHDVVNQLALAHGYLDLLRDPSHRGSSDEYFEKVECSLRRVMGHLASAREMERVGNEQPRWVVLIEQVEEALAHLELGGLEVCIDAIDGIKVFSDPMIWKVFYNLVHNTIVHAEGATRIRVSAEASDGDLDIIYEDNGPGIPLNEKGSLFEWGNGVKHAGGLYLVREILSVNGMEIEEVGESGARFVIHVPAHRWRER